MLADIDPSVGVIVAALVGAAGMVFATLWSQRTIKRRIGKPNGSGDLSQMVETLVHESGKQRVETVMMRSMVEELGTKLQDHMVEDNEHFETLDARLKGLSDAEESHAQAATDDRAQIASDLAVQQEQD